MIPRQLPSQHEKERLKHDVDQREAEEIRRRKENRLRQAVDALLKTEDGKIFWAYLWTVCGFNKSSLARLANNDIAVLTTECKEAQRIIYIESRKLATPELLAKAEFAAEFGEEVKTKKGDGKDATT